MKRPPLRVWHLLVASWAIVSGLVYGVLKLVRG